MKLKVGIEIRIGIPLPLVCLHHSLFTLVTLESETVNADCYQSVSLSTFSNLYSSLLCSFLSIWCLSLPLLYFFSTRLERHQLLHLFVNDTKLFGRETNFDSFFVLTFTMTFTSGFSLNILNFLSWIEDWLNYVLMPVIKNSALTVKETKIKMAHRYPLTFTKTPTQKFDKTLAANFT